MTEANRALALRWFDEVWNQRMEGTVDELLAPGSIGHMEGDENCPAERFKAVRAAFLSAMPDLRLEVEDTVAEGDDVVVRWRLTGTHSGNGLDIPPTQTRVDRRGMTWHKIVDGQIVEGWDSWNSGALMETLRTEARRQGA